MDITMAPGFKCQGKVFERISKDTIEYPFLTGGYLEVSCCYRFYVLIIAFDYEQRVSRFLENTPRKRLLSPHHFKDYLNNYNHSFSPTAANKRKNKAPRKMNRILVIFMKDCRLLAWGF
jgi:hypothetical protein